jgi:type II secretory pathway component GspD/PulD (secretin)
MRPPDDPPYIISTRLQKIESGTVLTITPYVGDNNDITLQMAVEVSDSVPQARGSNLPLVTRRTAKNAVTVKDGGTVAVAGLTENRSRTDEQKVPFLGDIPLIGGLFKNHNNDKSNREVAVFVTAHLVAEGTQPTNRLAEPAPVAATPEAAPDDFRRQLENSMRKGQ